MTGNTSVSQAPPSLKRLPRAGVFSSSRSSCSNACAARLEYLGADTGCANTDSESPAPTTSCHRRSLNPCVLSLRRSNSLGYEMRTIVPLMLLLAIPTAEAQSINRCKIGGKVVYTDQACGTSLQRQIDPAEPAPQQVPRRMSDAEHNNLEMAQEWDRRMAQRDRDLATEQASTSAKQNAAAANCATLRQEKEAVLSNLRHGGTAQWMNYWNERFHTVSDALYRNRC